MCEIIFCEGMNVAGIYSLKSFTNIKKLCECDTNVKPRTVQNLYLPFLYICTLYYTNIIYHTYIHYTYLIYFTYIHYIMHINIYIYYTYI